MKRNDRIFYALALTLVFTILYVSFGDFSSRCKEVRDKSVRLHILASSDSEEDQRVKLLVRDEILRKYGDIMAGCKNREDAKRKLSNLKDDIRASAIEKLRQEGKNDDVRVDFENIYFDSREYSKNVIMPAGFYDALRVEIGKAEGKNWWCVMYPPLCIPVYCQKDAVVLTERIESLRLENDFRAKFAFVEMSEKIAKRLRNR